MKIKKHNYGKKQYPHFSEISPPGFKSLVAGLGIGLAVLGCKDSSSKEAAGDNQSKEKIHQKNYPVRPAGVVRPPDTKKDSDGDGIADYQDKCPHRPETYNNYQDKDGCPDTPGQIEDGQNNQNQDKDQDGKVIKVLNTGNPPTKPPEPPVKPPEPPTKPPEPIVKPPEPPVKQPPPPVRLRGRPRMPRKPKTPRNQ